MQAKSDMLAGRLGAAQVAAGRDPQHERAGKDPQSDFNNTNRIDISWYPNRIE